MRIFVSAVIATSIGLFASAASAEMASECYAECKAMQDSYDELLSSTNDQAAISGGTTNELADMQTAIQACNMRCDALNAVQEEFRACVTKANEDAEKYNYAPEVLQELIENCRLGYTLDREEFFN